MYDIIYGEVDTNGNRSGGVVNQIYNNFFTIQEFDSEIVKKLMKTKI